MDSQETSKYVSSNILLKSRFFSRINNWLNQRQPSEELILVGLGLVVGIGAGLGAVIFRYLINGVSWIAYEWFPDLTPGWGNAYVLIIPAFGGLLVGLLVYFFAPEAKGHGVPEVMEAVAIRGGRIRPIVAVIKSLASAICIGSGGSAGREGPIVQIGSALGSTLGQALDMSDDRIRNLVACGAAGGIAATFNAPIAGVIFALEIILGQFEIRYFSTVVISSVTASVIGRVVFGDTPAFPLPTEYGVYTHWEFIFYILLGVIAALVGVVFVRSLYWTEDIFDNWKKAPPWLKPAIGGGLLGFVALIYPLTTGVTYNRVPQVYNVGYEVITSALSNKLLLGVVLSLLVLKIIATSLTLGSGGSGGVFAPSLFMGAMLGTAFELIVRIIFPGIIAPPGAYALVGMAAVFAASAHAPITAIIILFELTGDYRIILPLMLTVVVSTLLSQKFLKGESIYTLKLSRRGIHLKTGYDTDVMRGIEVKEAMTRSVDSVSENMTLAELSSFFSQTRHHGLPVLDENGKLWGIVTVSDIDRAVETNKPAEVKVRDIATKREKMLVAYPDESMGEALVRMGVRGVGRLPVVSRDDPTLLLGLIRRADIIRAYNLGITRRAETHKRTQKYKEMNLDEADFVNFEITKEDEVVGKYLKDFAPCLPDDCVLVSIQREGNILFPRGKSVFKAGDRITAFVRKEDVEFLQECIRGGDES
jgi:CIC family chloride channel protein